jgi:serine protease Do
VIIEFDGRPVEDDDHLMSLVSMTPVDSVVRVALFRDRGRTEVRLTVAKRADFEP